MKMDWSTETGIAELVEDAQLSSASKDRHSHKGHNSFAPSFKWLVIVIENVYSKPLTPLVF